MFISRRLPFLLIVSAVLSGQFAHREHATAKQPNILFIYTDDQSHRTVSCYDEAFDWVQTPNIDQLAREGVRFRRAYIGAWCMPSRATLLMGHHQHGIESMRMEGTYPGSAYDAEKCRFWPSVLRQHGYSTAHIGKWHQGFHAPAYTPVSSRPKKTCVPSPRSSTCPSIVSIGVAYPRLLPYASLTT